MAVQPGTALLVIDMQRDFLDPLGYVAPLPGDPDVHDAMIRCSAGEGGILGRVLDTHAVVTAWSA